MPEIRKDPIVDRWVVIAPDRARRPIEVSDISDLPGSGFDPFAEGNESWTPNEIFAVRRSESSADGPGWQVRVIPNKYPAVVSSGDIQSLRDGFYQSMTGFGFHEVIIECPHDETSLARLSVANIQDVLSAYHQRMITLKQDSRIAHALIFKNKGASAGASLRHSHSQLIATPLVPIAIQEQIGGANRYYQQHGRSVFEELIDRELEIGSRVVLNTDAYLAFCPYASRFPYETWIVPKRQHSHFETIDEQSLQKLAKSLKSVLQKIERGLNDPPYNYMIHTAPFHEAAMPHYCWHMEIFPRLTRVAGFEWGSGFYINPVPPEEAARVLREAFVSMVENQ